MWLTRYYGNPLFSSNIDSLTQWNGKDLPRKETYEENERLGPADACSAAFDKCRIIIHGLKEIFLLEITRRHSNLLISRFIFDKAYLSA